MTGEPIRALIVDDEPLVRQGIAEFLADERDIEVVGEARDGLEAVAAIDALRPDLLFLDVQMPELDGFDVLSGLEPADVPAVVFVTAYEQYALRAFEAHAIDYLLKPFDRDRFLAALARARAQIAWRREHGAGLADFAALLDRLRTERRSLERFVVKHAGRILLIPADEVEWIEARGNYVQLHHPRGPHLVRDTVGQLEKALDPRRFLRIHRSTIVRLSAIAELQRLSAGDYLVRTHGGAELTLSRSYKKALEEALGRRF